VPWSPDEVGWNKGIRLDSTHTMLAKDVPMDHGTDDSCAPLWNSKLKGGRIVDD
jgi:hypothetical protein